ncbi:MAG: lysine transporter LysE [Sphingobacteriales bacterium]|nr:MAG: lysine transporter LysE [Sphingobacteriales bacterium]
MHFLDAIIKGLAIGLFMAISVGPTLFAVIKYSLNHSYRAGLAFIAGVSFSDIMYVTIANVAASWLEELNEHKRYIAYGGAIILIIVGLMGVLRKHKPPKSSDTKITISNGKLFRIFGSGFLINTINPGVIITWLAAVTASADEGTLYRVVLFGTCLVLILVIDIAKVFLADTIRRKLTARRIMLLQKFSAFCILGIGIALLLGTAFNLKFTRNAEPEQSAYHHFQSFNTKNLIKA